MTANDAVCIASGPSLTEDDCLSVRKWRAASPDRIVIVTNSTWMRCPWADIVYCMDYSYIRQYGKQMESEFSGKIYASLRCAQSHKIKYEVAKSRTFGNSGAGAMALAWEMGARRIIMLGYDCAKTGGRAHWHADHPRPLTNAKSVSLWPRHFKMVKTFLDSKKVQVVNASRVTALTCFPRATLEDVLMC